MKTLEQRIQALEDREAIIKLKYRYVNINDGGWTGPTHTNPDAIADMFTDDGVWDGMPHVPYAQGREEIRELFKNFGVMPFIVHYVTNPLIEVDGDTATGHWHALVTATLPNRDAVWTLGLYDEVYRRTADGWKIHKLRFITAANTTYDLGWGKKQFAFGGKGYEDVVKF